MERKSLFVMSVLLITVFAVLACVFCFNGPDEPQVLGRVPNCAKTVTAFFDCVSDGNFKKAEKYLAGKAKLGMDKEFSDQSEKKLFDVIKSSYSYTLLDQPKIDGINAVQKVRFVSFSVNEAKADMAVLTDQYYREKVASIKTNDEIYDANHNLKKEVAMEIFDRALDTVISKRDIYYCGNDLDINLVYEGGNWKIVLDERLISALLGGL
ncbi:MAG: hypothetical protein IJL87_10700 [Clostridia bacterium]|nr:hypothetical protein [Clostridia bacterium]